MKKLLLLVIIAIPALPLLCSENPKSMSSLAYGAASECPTHDGTRLNRSEIARYQSTNAYLEGRAVHQSHQCKQTVAIHWIGPKGESRILTLEAKDSAYELVDFSPVGSKVLVQWTKTIDEGLAQERELIGLLSLSSGIIAWKDVWKTMGWGNCWATVDAQGFLPDGRVVIRPRRSIRTGHEGADCVARPILYAWRWDTGAVERLADDVVITRYGKETALAHQPCKTDPDIIGECLWTHGRASFYNGSPSTRIWQIGTNRMLGVTTEELPRKAADLLSTGKDFFGNELYGDFEVCPFTKKKPGSMQFVCVESAKNLILKRP